MRNVLSSINNDNKNNTTLITLPTTRVFNFPKNKLGKSSYSKGLIYDSRKCKGKVALRVVRKAGRTHDNFQPWHLSLFTYTCSSIKNSSDEA